MSSGWGDCAFLRAPGRNTNADTTSFPQESKNKKEWEFGGEQTGIQILSLSLTRSVILEKPLILSELLFIHV